jgi:alpha-N-acetylglucosamine transferase
MKDTENKKKIGKFKDELHSLPMKEFLALNPKVYSMIHNEFDKENQEIILNKNTKKLKRCIKSCG